MFPEGRVFELLIAAVVALIVVGPKDLPVLLRRFGQFMARVRAMAAEFRASFDEMARQSELDELRKEVEAMRKGQLADIAHPEVNQAFNEISQGLSDVGVQLNAPVTAGYEPVQTAHIEPAAPAPKPRARKAAPKKAPAKAAAAKKTQAPRMAAPKAAAKKPTPKAPATKPTVTPAAKPKPAAAKRPTAKPASRKATVS